MEIMQIDLRELKSKVHYEPALVESYQTQCRIKVESYGGEMLNCGTWLKQDVEICPGCGSPVVWLNSKIWREAAGVSPADRLRDLKTMPTDKLGQRFLKWVSDGCDVTIVRFSNQKDKKRWHRAVKNLTEEEIKEVANHCANKNESYALIKHVLNTLDMKVKGELKSSEQEEGPEDFWFNLTSGVSDAEEDGHSLSKQ